MRACVAAAILMGILAAATTFAATPWGGDDSGFIPPNPTLAKCQNAAAKATGKAVVCFIKCHIARANGQLADETSEDACEAACTQKFTTTGNKLAGHLDCSCVDFPDMIFSAEHWVDQDVNLNVYCGPPLTSPSSAFLDRSESF